MAARSSQGSPPGSLLCLTLLMCVSFYAVCVSTFPIGHSGSDSKKILSRHERSANVTQQVSGIEAFFQDNNNIAMYLVLPLIVLVYGGCSAIYCVAKCRRYIKKKNRQKRHIKNGTVKPPANDNGSRGLPDGTDKDSAGSERNFSGKGTTSRSDSQLSDNRSIPGQIQDYDDNVPLVASTARKHTPAPSLDNERMSAMDNNHPRQSRNEQTPASIERDGMYSRNSDVDANNKASKAALFTVSNTRRRDSTQTVGQRSNYDMNTPSTSRQDNNWGQPPPRHQFNEDPKAGFKAMFSTPYNPLYSHNADPWESMRAMEMKSMGQESSAPWANQMKYDEFGRVKPQKKQRLIFVA